MNYTYHILFLLFFFSFSIDFHAQEIISKEYSLKWHQSEHPVNATNIKKSKYYTFNRAIVEDRGFPYAKFSESVKVNGPITAKVTISNAHYSPVQPEINATTDWPTNHNLYTSLIQERQEFYLGINLDPIINRDGIISRLDSFTLIIHTTPNYKLLSKSGPIFKNKSALNEGEIYKLAIPNTGIYKLDYSFLKDSLEIDLTTLNASSIQLWGNTGGKLAESIEISRIDDLEEVAVYSEGFADGKFNTNDYLLFYYEGASKISIDGRHQDFTYISNIYDDNNYVFLKIGGERGTTPTEANIRTTEKSFSQYDEFQIHEWDKTNLLDFGGFTQGSGQKWFGELFKNQRTFNFENKFDFKNIALNHPVGVKMSFAGRSNLSSTVTLTIDKNNYKKNIRSVSTGNVESTFAALANFHETLQFSSSSPKLEIYYANNSAGTEGWLDFLSIRFKKELILNNSFLIFQELSSSKLSSYSFELRNVTNETVIWNITNPLKIKNQNFQLTGNTATFGVNQHEEIKRFVAFDKSANFPNPTFNSKLENQNLHSIQEAEMIIVYHPNFEMAAKQLAKHREMQDGLIVRTANIHQIFNEFSAGRQDPSAIRDFAKMIYDRYDGFRYMLLLGDGSFDYRHVDKNLENQSFIPAYESISSMNPINAFPTDDYFALLSDTEGDNLKGALDIAVGRLPVKSSSEADIIVNKIISYESNPNSFGDWRTRLLFSADDEDYDKHLDDANDIAKKTNKNFPKFNQEKVYFDAFKQESTPGGSRYPAANKKINESVFNGILLYNYLGHGGPKGLSQERVVKIDDINSWKNLDKLTVFITATCSFTGYDDPKIVTAGEESILNPTGGAVALLSTVRSVYASENARLTQAVYDRILEKENGDYLRLGEVMRKAKNSNSSDTLSINARKFLVIGDPCLKLSIPKYDISTDMINNQNLETFKDTINALSIMQIEGSIRDNNGNIIEDFNGTVYPTIYDKESSITTLQNDSDSPQRKFNVRRNVMFKGTASVDKGKFKFSFVVPKDISYNYGDGRISYYAYNGKTDDAFGFTEDFIVGGSANKLLLDNQGPLVEVYMNDENFVSGGITNDSPILFAKLSDENGINISSSSIGHELIGILDNNTKESIELNEFFVGSLNDYTSGEIRYPLSDLSPGRHQLVVKAFDVANNSSEGMIEFIVLEKDKTSITRMLNYPNPFTTTTQFSFEHTFNGANIDIAIDIYTLSGKLVKSIRTNKLSHGFRVNDIAWDGKDDYGQQLGRGIYLYKIKINAPEVNISAESTFEKLVILK